MPKHNSIDYPVEEIRGYIRDGKTHQWIADLLAKTLDSRVTAKLIYKVCKKNGIVCQRTGPRAAEGHPKWQGGKIFSRLGYVKVFCPEHPTCVAVNQRREKQSNGRYFRKQKYVWQHRLVMEKHLGRFLGPHEVVHHINGVRDDNRVENLQVFQTNADHLAMELRGRCPKWSEDGKARLRLAVKKAAAKRHSKALLGVHARQQTPDHLKAECEALAQQVFEKALQLQQSPNDPCSTSKHDAFPELNQFASIHQEPDRKLESLP